MSYLNAKGSFSNGREVIREGSFKLQEGNKNILNGKYLGK